MADSKLMERLEADLRPREREALEACERLCRETGASLYLVGGAVRDLVLGRSSIDLDLAMEADVEPVARRLAALLRGRLVLHARFGTATVYGRGFQLDIARTRRETYAHPGALPAVEHATLVEDLDRRDFAFNAMALRLTEPRGELVDPFDGGGDIGRRVIRVLHERSFQDDATRALRAVRYAARLDFGLEEQTEAWLGRDLAYLDTISGARLRRELTLQFEEEGAVRAFEMAQALGVLGAIHAPLSVDERRAGRWREALSGEHFGPLDELGLCILVDPSTDEEVEAVSERLHLLGRVERTLKRFVSLRASREAVEAASESPAELADLLDGVAPAAVWAFAYLLNDVNQGCLRYLSEWSKVKPLLTGKDLLALGIEPGAGMGDVLRRLRRARLAGEASTREDELALLAEWRSAGE